MAGAGAVEEGAEAQGNGLTGHASMLLRAGADVVDEQPPTLGNDRHLNLEVGGAPTVTLPVDHDRATAGGVGRHYVGRQKIGEGVICSPERVAITPPRVGRGLARQER